MPVPKLQLGLPRADLERIGEQAVGMIVERTLSGKDKTGADFMAYSRRPFARPAGGQDGDRGAIRRLVAQGDAVYFTAKSGALWALIVGGYDAYKRERMRGTDYDGTPNLSLTGRMLGGLRVLSVRGTLAGGTIVISFNRPEEARKASYVSGRRPFMGLTSEERARLLERFAGDVKLNVN